VEWVEVAGRTVEEATEHALDQLGVAASDAEVIVLSEPKTGLFGRVRIEARVRARVRPVGVRPKRERSRDRRSGRSRQSAAKSGQRSAAKGGRSEGVSQGAAETRTAAGVAGAGTSRSARRRRNRKQAVAVAAANGSDPQDSAATETSPPNSSQDRTQPKETSDMAEGMTLEEQGEAGRAFLAGLLAEYGMQASVEARLIDDDTVEIAATGADLGVLVGPRGSTLAALQDLTRAVVQRQCPSRTDRILVDVAGYREKRSAALKRFSAQIAEEVLASGQERALEAMSPADRKAVHDAVNEMTGVVTRSEGEDPNRYIVIAPG
jgi:spoIIIJ-associated protein